MHALGNGTNRNPFAGLAGALPSMVLGLVLACAGPPTALAAEPPDEGGLNSAISTVLPAYWSVEAVEIVTSENQGDEVSPRFRQRFIADARPKEDLFLPVPGDGRIGPFSVLITTGATSEIRKLYGTATSVVELGELSTRIELENSVLGIGLPRSLYAGPVLVAGAARTDEVADQFVDLHVLSKTVAEGVARSAANAEALEGLAAEERAALELLNRNRLGALRENYEQEARLAAEAADQARQEIAAANQARIAALKAELEAETEALERQKGALSQERQLLVDDSRRLMDDLAEKVRQDNAAFAAFAEEQRERQMTENQTRIDALKAELATEEARIDELAAGLAVQLQAETESLERQKDALNQERQLLVNDSRRLMDALAEKVRQDNAAFAAFAEEQRERQMAENQARIDALKAELVAEEARIDELAAGLAQERRLLVEANQAKLAELEAQYQLRREEVSASQETLDAIANAEAETQAQVLLGEVLQALADERMRVAGILETIDAEDVARRKARREAVIAALSADDGTQRAAAFNSILAGDDDELKNIAFGSILAGEDEELKSIAIEVVLTNGAEDFADWKDVAIDEALKSGNSQLQEIALSEKINKSRRIVLTFFDEEGAVTATHWLDHAPFANGKSGSFEGEYNPNWTYDILDPNSRNMLNGGKLQITGTWTNRFGERYSCTSIASPDRGGNIVGTVHCNGDDFAFNTEVRIDL